MKKDPESVGEGSVPEKFQDVLQEQVPDLVQEPVSVRGSVKVQEMDPEKKEESGLEKARDLALAGMSKRI